MGGIVNFEAKVIERVFKEMGYQIEVNNPHPFVEYNTHPAAISETEDEYIERVKQIRHNDTKIKIEVEHYPWGG